jgi:hypothetical protein
MSTRQFTGLVIALIGVLFVMLLIEDYRRCREAGHTDCPRIGDSIWPVGKQRPSGQ